MVGSWKKYSKCGVGEISALDGVGWLTFGGEVGGELYEMSYMKIGINDYTNYPAMHIIVTYANIFFRKVSLVLTWFIYQ